MPESGTYTSTIAMTSDIQFNKKSPWNKIAGCPKWNGSRSKNIISKEDKNHKKSGRWRQQEINEQVWQY